MSRVLLSVGDASGDQHAADLCRALARRRPDCRLVGMGGPRMREAGAELLVDQRDLAVGGLLELAGSALSINRAWRTLGRVLEADPPDLVVLVDSGAFNLPFARRVRRTCGARILYYVAPQVWAWRPGRIRKLARRVDAVALILPFEAAHYEPHDVRAEFVGHPLVEPLERLRGDLDRGAARASLGLDPLRRWVALLPGSRRNEVRHHLPVQLEAARRMHARDPKLAFAVAVAPSIEPDQVESILRGANLPALMEVRAVLDRTRPLLVASEAVLAKPGTGVLEAALLECPTVVVGIAQVLTAAFVKRAIRVPHLAMPNLVAGREVVPEFMQRDARPEALAEAVLGLLDGPARDRQLDDLRAVRDALGGGGAAERAAALAEELLDAG